jgi:hypothetical protein
VTRPGRMSADMHGILAALARRSPAAAGARGHALALSTAPNEALVAKNEVLLVVMGPDGALVQRTTSPSAAIDFDEIGLNLLRAEAALGALLASRAAPSPRLSRTEAALLDEAGFDEGDGAGPGALERSQIAYQLLLETSLTLERAARALRVSPSRLRQRLGARTLFGIKDGRSWRLPRFQFEGRRLARGLEKVLPRIPPDAHPLAVQSWFQDPHQDLVVGPDEEPVSPLHWLKAGNPPEVVAELAAEI